MVTLGRVTPSATPAIDDLADQPCLVTGRRTASRVSTASRGTTASIPSPRLKTCSISSSATSPAACTSAKIRGSSQVPRRTTASQWSGRTREVAGQAAAGDVGEGVHGRGAAARHRRRVDHARPEQLVAERVVRAPPGGSSRRRRRRRAAPRRASE